jgi:hypothetical protein
MAPPCRLRNGPEAGPADHRANRAIQRRRSQRGTRVQPGEAEGEGFEPRRTQGPRNGFRDRAPFRSFAGRTQLRAPLRARMRASPTQAATVTAAAASSATRASQASSVRPVGSAAPCQRARRASSDVEHHELRRRLGPLFRRCSERGWLRRCERADCGLVGGGRRRVAGGRHDLG